MPIQITKVNLDQPQSIVSAIDKLARNAQKLTNVSEGGHLYTTTIPEVADIEEGSFVPVLTGGTIYLYTKYGGVRYRIQFTAA